MSDLVDRARFLAGGQDDPHSVTITELADRIVELEAEMARRDANETRNCLNWGPCSLNDGRMSEGANAPATTQSERQSHE